MFADGQCELVEFIENNDYRHVAAGGRGEGDRIGACSDHPRRALMSRTHATMSLSQGTHSLVHTTPCAAFIAFCHNVENLHSPQLLW